MNISVQFNFITFFSLILGQRIDSIDLSVVDILDVDEKHMPVHFLAPCRISFTYGMVSVACDYLIQFNGPIYLIDHATNLSYQFKRVLQKYIFNLNITHRHQQQQK